ncbi:hypothetical protein LP420_35915 [Massilia sp. B-10]|nr:hypothetical protein LP420_35915 [Massilia sp. B-10]UUZ53819.1 hypothetical protein LP419_35350 [Massilia sp. H-1]
MGRLFWKFFFAILLAQVAATVGVGATFWLWNQTRELSHQDSAPRALIDTRPSAVTIVDGAEVALKFGGLPAAARTGRARHLQYPVRDRRRRP